MLPGAPTVKCASSYFKKSTNEKSFWSAYSGTHSLFNFEKVHFPMHNFEKKKHSRAPTVELMLLQKKKNNKREVKE